MRGRRLEWGVGRLSVEKGERGREEGGRGGAGTGCELRRIILWGVGM